MSVTIDVTGLTAQDYRFAPSVLAELGSALHLLVEPGHQFEWAWLLDRWGRARGAAQGEAAARRLYAAGLRGVDRHREVAVNSLWDDFSVRDGWARLWPPESPAPRVAACRRGRISYGQSR